MLDNYFSYGHFNKPYRASFYRKYYNTNITKWYKILIFLFLRYSLFLYIPRFIFFFKENIVFVPSINVIFRTSLWNHYSIDFPRQRSLFGISLERVRTSPSISPSKPFKKSYLIVSLVHASNLRKMVSCFLYGSRFFSIRPSVLVKSEFLVKRSPYLPSNAKARAHLYLSDNFISILWRSLNHR